VSACQVALAGSVRCVQIVPSGDVAATVLPDPMTPKTPPFQATADQEPALATGIDQVAPSGDVAIRLFKLTAQKIVPFQVTEVHLELTGSVRCVQVVPSGDVAAMALP
jgi:hypothetical protein